MNPSPSEPCQALELVDIIDFKWLMAREGHHIHVERLQRDACYARACVALAADSAIAALRDAARRLSPGIPAAQTPT